MMTLCGDNMILIILIFFIYTKCALDTISIKYLFYKQHTILGWQFKKKNVKLYKTSMIGSVVQIILIWHDDFGVSFSYKKNV